MDRDANRNDIENSNGKDEYIQEDSTVYEDVAK